MTEREITMGLFTKGNMDYNAGMRAHESRDYEKALRHFEKAADAGHPDAVFQCIVYYMNGRGCERNLEKALYYSKKNELIGTKDAYKLTNSLKQEVEKEKREAELERQKKDAERRESASHAKEAFLAQIEVANEAYIKKDYETTLKIIQPMVDCGIPEAEAFMAQLYQLGHGVEKSDLKAAQLYRKSAEKGIPTSGTQIAICYAKGQGVPQDMDMALKWAEKAKALGAGYSDELVKSIYQASLILGNRTIIDKSEMDYPDNEYDADELFTIACDKLDAENYEVALGIALRLALREDPGGIYLSAQMLMTGQGTKPNKTLAFYLYKILADAGDADAQLMCGTMLYNGAGVEKDRAEALFLFEKSAEKGNPTAQYNCGFLYDFMKKREKSIYWMRQAAKQTKDQAVKENALKFLIDNNIPPE